MTQPPAPTSTDDEAASDADATGMRTPPERALTREGRARADNSARMRIGEVAERLRLSLRSIRHYEDCGLVRPSDRTAGGFRLYSELDVQRLLLIMQMKPLGFTLDEMRQVLTDLDVLDAAHDGAEGGGNDGADARDRLVGLAADVDQRWADLRQRLDIAAMFRDHLAQELGDTAAAPSTSSGSSQG